jgi:hypothetical protein
MGAGMSNEARKNQTMMRYFVVGATTTIFHFIFASISLFFCLCLTCRQLFRWLAQTASPSYVAVSDPIFSMQSGLLMPV